MRSRLALAGAPRARRPPGSRLGHDRRDHELGTALPSAWGL